MLKYDRTTYYKWKEKYGDPFEVTLNGCVESLKCSLTAEQPDIDIIFMSVPLSGVRKTFVATVRSPQAATDDLPPVGAAIFFKEIEN